MDATEQTDTGFQARCLLRQVRWGTLATEQPGEAGEAAPLFAQPCAQPCAQPGAQPFATLVTHAVAADGAILLLMSSMAMHSRHLQANPRCALMVAGPPENANWQTAARVTVTGTAAVIDDAAQRAYWVGRHPYAAGYAQFSDFMLWRLQPLGGLFVAGFGRINRLTADDLACGADAVGALAAAAAGLVAHCNTEHAEALSRIARAAGAHGPWRMLGVDPDGFDLVQDDSVLRIAFAAPVQDAAAARAALVGLAEAAGRHF